MWSLGSRTGLLSVTGFYVDVVRLIHQVRTALAMTDELLQELEHRLTGVLHTTGVLTRGADGDRPSIDGRRDRGVFDSELLGGVGQPGSVVDDLGEEPFR